MNNETERMREGVFPNMYGETENYRYSCHDSLSVGPDFNPRALLEEGLPAILMRSLIVPYLYTRVLCLLQDNDIKLETLPWFLIPKR
jgi:hypothetical protein